MAMPLVTTVAEASLGLPTAAPTVQLTTENTDNQLWLSESPAETSLDNSLCAAHSYTITNKPKRGRRP